MTETGKLPHWDLTTIYPSLTSPEFNKAFDQARQRIDELEKFCAGNLKSQNQGQTPSANQSELAAEMINLLNSSYLLAYTLNNYISSFTTTDSYDTTATRLYSQIQALIVRIESVENQFSSWIGTFDDLSLLVENNATNLAHRFYIQEKACQSNFLMSDEEESLASELSLSGLRAWHKLQGTITSQLNIDFELNGSLQTLPLPALQNIRRYNPDSAVREKAFNAEIRALESVREPLTACMNGVKGYFNTLNKRRGRQDALHSSIDTARIDRATLEAMMAAIKNSYPIFRRYLKAKAKRFGKDELPWWDLFAPVGNNNRVFTWTAGKEFIIENFGLYSEDLASLARHAFNNHWIDAEPRDGKRGGAFCMRIHAAEESRILCNFDGSFDQVSTVAHELGHAYHIECQKGKQYLQYVTPMTLAETASIFCETIILEAAMEAASTPQEELAILETALINDTQVIIDISSRFEFEQEVFERRQEADLSADELCDIITNAQISTYGDALDQDHLHPYMWAWKPHYYRYDLSFYNYPYAFGLLFSTGLYAIFKQRGAAFVPEFRDLLASTGMADAAELASRFDIDIHSQEFWQSSLFVIEERINRYMQL